MMLPSLQCGMTVQTTSFATLITAHVNGQTLSAMVNAKPPRIIVDRIFDVDAAVHRLIREIEQGEVQ